MDTCVECGRYAPTQAGRCSACDLGITAMTKIPVAWSCAKEAGSSMRCAQWCGDRQKCVASLPTLDEVSADFADKIYGSQSHNDIHREGEP